MKGTDGIYRLDKAYMQSFCNSILYRFFFKVEPHKGTEYSVVTGS